MAVGAVVAVPILLNLFGLAPLLGGVISYARWPVLECGMAVALGLLYRYGPSCKHARRSLLGWGAIIATAIWLAGSWVFSFYVENFATYNETYGSLGSVIILLMWLLLSVYAILLGAEIDSAIERRAGRPERAAGERRVYDRRQPVAAAR
jgi:membrane protein